MSVSDAVCFESRRQWATVHRLVKSPHLSLCLFVFIFMLIRCLLASLFSSFASVSNSFAFLFSHFIFTHFVRSHACFVS